MTLEITMEGHTSKQLTNYNGVYIQTTHKLQWSNTSKQLTNYNGGSDI